MPEWFELATAYQQYIYPLLSYFEPVMLSHIYHT